MMTTLLLSTLCIATCIFYFVAIDLGFTSVSLFCARPDDYISWLLYEILVISQCEGQFLKH